MDAFKSYLLTAMLASLAASLLIRISDHRFRSYLRYVAGLALLLLLTMPLTSLAEDLQSSLSEIGSYQEESVSSSQKESIDQIGGTMSTKIGDMVAVRYKIPRDAISVKLTLDLSDLSAISIYRLDLTVRVFCNSEEIQRYLSESLSCPVSVTVAEGEME